MPRADLPMSNKQPTRSGAIDFSFELLTTAILNQLKNLGIIEDFKGQGGKAKIKKVGKKSFTKVSAKSNENLLKRQFKKNPKAFQEEKPEEKKPEEELKDKPSDIARQKKGAEPGPSPPTETKEPDAYLDHPLNRVLIELNVEPNPLKKKKILRKARQLYKKHRTQNSLPRKIVSQRKGQAPYRRISYAKDLLDPAPDKLSAIDKARVLRSDLIDDIKEEGGLPSTNQEAFLYFVASAHARKPDKLVREYFKNRQAFMADMRREWQSNDNKQAYESMSQDGVDIDAMTPDMITNYETRVGFEEKEESREKVSEEKTPSIEAKDFQLPKGSTRMALQPELKQFTEDIAQANTDDEERKAVDRFMENPRVQRAARQAGNAADFVNLFRNSPAWEAAAPAVKEVAKIAVTSAITARFLGTPEVQEEKDPVKIETELNRLREQLANLRTSKLNEQNEEQTFKKLRKFRPEIREFNPERLNYFISAENEDLEKKELINFAYIPEVSQAGVYTEDYKDNPIVTGNIHNENIRFSNTKKQSSDYHPVGTYMILDRIGKQMADIRADFNKAIASMRHQQRVDDGMFNQVFNPRIPPVENPRNRRYRDMGDNAMKFASEPIVSLPKIDDNGVGRTNAHRDFITSYSYRRHYIK